MNLKNNELNRIEFYDCDVFDSFKDDIASMEHPIYSLSKLDSHRVVSYEKNGCKIEISSGNKGLPTILDKDIMVYLTSSLMASKNKGEKISQTIRFTARDYLIVTKKGLGGSQYKQLFDGLERLKGTTIKTNIKTNGIEITELFGLIDNVKEIKLEKESKEDRVVAITIKLSDWCYNSILGNEVLTIDPDYFKLGKPTDKRLYELARKHCGNQVVWKIKLENLKEKLGTTSPIRTLRFNIKKTAETNHLPEYNITLEENDVVMFTRKYPPKESVKPAQLPAHVSKSAILKLANPGETEQQVRDRLSKLAEQKGIPLKAVITELSAWKQAKRSKVKEPEGKAITKPDASKIQKLKDAAAGKQGKTP
jgi:plasmid replication initiation protein